MVVIGFLLGRRIYHRRYAGGGREDSAKCQSQQDSADSKRARH